jgi:ribosomal protein S27AE
MTTLRKNRCPKCGGNMFLYNDYEGWYEQCLQCSLTKYLNVIVKNKEKVGVKTAVEMKKVAS